MVKMFWYKIAFVIFMFFLAFLGVVTLTYTMFLVFRAGEPIKFNDT